MLLITLGIINILNIIAKKSIRLENHLKQNWIPRRIVFYLYQIIIFRNEVLLEIDFLVSMSRFFLSLSRARIQMTENSLVRFL